MKKSKSAVLILMAVAAMATATACAGKKDETVKTGAAAETTAAAESTEEENSSSSTEEAKESTAEESEEISEAGTEGGQMTGTLEGNKGFMFSVVSDDDKEVYTFDLPDESLLKGIKEGDKIIVTYKGEDPKNLNPAGYSLEKVEKAK